MTDRSAPVYCIGRRALVECGGTESTDFIPCGVSIQMLMDVSSSVWFFQVTVTEPSGSSTALSSVGLKQETEPPLLPSFVRAVK